MTCEDFRCKFATVTAPSEHQHREGALHEGLYHVYSCKAAVQSHLLDKSLRRKALPTECTPIDAAAALGLHGMPGCVPLQGCVGCVQNRPDAVARKILRFLETGHDDLVVMLNNALIKAGRFEEGARLAGKTPHCTPQQLPAMDISAGLQAVQGSTPIKWQVEGADGSACNIACLVDRPNCAWVMSQKAICLCVM